MAPRGRTWELLDSVGEREYWRYLVDGREPVSVIYDPSEGAYVLPPGHFIARTDGRLFEAPAKTTLRAMARYLDRQWRLGGRVQGYPSVSQFAFCDRVMYAPSETDRVLSEGSV